MRSIITKDEFQSVDVVNAVSIDCFVKTVRFWRPLPPAVREFKYGERLLGRSLVQRGATEYVSLNVIRCNNNSLQSKTKMHLYHNSISKTISLYTATFVDSHRTLHRSE
jgi:hypothetical protein